MVAVTVLQRLVFKLKFASGCVSRLPHWDGLVQSNSVGIGTFKLCHGAGSAGKSGCGPAVAARNFEIMMSLAGSRLFRINGWLGHGIRVRRLPPPPAGRAEFEISLNIGSAAARPVTDIEVGSAVTTVTDRFSSSSYYGHGVRSVTAAAAAGPPAGAGSVSVPALSRCPGSGSDGFCPLAGVTPTVTQLTQTLIRY